MTTTTAKPRATTPRIRKTKPTTAPMSVADQEFAAMQVYIAKITSSKKEARAFLTSAGIIDKTGQLSKHYRP